MKQSEIIQKLSKLPEDMLQSASDYIDFLLQKAQKDADKDFEQRMFGIGKGKGKIASDFNDPIDDMKDYM